MNKSQIRELERHKIELETMKLQINELYLEDLRLRSKLNSINNPIDQLFEISKSDFSTEGRIIYKLLSKIKMED